MLSSNAKKHMNIYLLGYGLFAGFGILVLILGVFFNILRDEMIGICAGFIPMGVIGIISTLRMKSKPEKAENMVRVKTEERRQHIRNRAGNLTFHISLYSLSAMVIISRYIAISLTLFLVITVLTLLAIYIISSIIYNKID